MCQWRRVELRKIYGMGLLHLSREMQASSFSYLHVCCPSMFHCVTQHTLFVLVLQILRAIGIGLLTMCTAGSFIKSPMRISIQACQSTRRWWSISSACAEDSFAIV
jgi:hypothetical protein